MQRLDIELNHVNTYTGSTALAYLDRTPAYILSKTALATCIFKTSSEDICVATLTLPSPSLPGQQLVNRTSLSCMSGSHRVSAAIQRLYIGFKGGCLRPCVTKSFLRLTTRDRSLGLSMWHSQTFQTFA